MDRTEHSHPYVGRYTLAELSSRRMRAIGALLARAFPGADTTMETRLEGLRRAASVKGARIFAVWEEARPLAHALTFPRTIITNAGPLTVMALAAVCSDPQRRGEGLGRAVVRAAFTDVDDGRYPVALFQTGVPQFYLKLGATGVSNPFRNSLFELETSRQGCRGAVARPWWETHVMVYPAAFPWPEGEIDLLGPGY